MTGDRVIRWATPITDYPITDHPLSLSPFGGLLSVALSRSFGVPGRCRPGRSSDGGRYPPPRPVEPGLSSPADGKGDKSWSSILSSLLHAQACTPTFPANVPFFTRRSDHPARSNLGLQYKAGAHGRECKAITSSRLSPNKASLAHRKFAVNYVPQLRRCARLVDD